MRSPSLLVAVPEPDSHTGQFMSYQAAGSLFLVVFRTRGLSLPLSLGETWSHLAAQYGLIDSSLGVPGSPPCCGVGLVGILDLP